MKTDQHGTGAIKHPDYHKRKCLGAEELGATIIVDFSKSTSLLEPPDEDQGSSSSCTSQADGYYIWQLTGGMQIIRSDTYSHTHLPGGGAYLIAPGEFHNENGLIPRSDKIVDPNPETEANMSKIIYALDDSNRIHAFSFTPVNIKVDINTIAGILEQYKGCIIGIDGNNTGWINMSDPTYNGKADWGHALYVFERAIRKNKNAIVEKSSWCSSGITKHFINSDYFAKGGVFEALVYADFKEISMNETKVVLSKDGKTVYKAIPIAEDWVSFQKQAAVEGIVIPNPIPPASSL